MKCENIKQKIDIICINIRKMTGILFLNRKVQSKNYEKTFPKWNNFNIFKTRHLKECYYASTYVIFCTNT